MLQLTDREWGEFEIEEIFNISKSKGRLTKEDFECNPGKTPVVTCSGENNGVAGHLDIQHLSKIKPVNNVLTVACGGVTGSTFYHGKDTVVSGGVLILEGKNFTSSKVYMFICTLVRKVCSKYSFGLKATKERICKLKIKLPLNDKGEIDYDFMERYIQEVEDSVYDSINETMQEIRNKDRG